MGLINRIKYDAPAHDAVAWKYPHDDIRLGAQLVVNESQEALFVKGGKALETFGPGTHTLSTGNLPLMSKLVNFGFFSRNTPFTAEIWFVNKTVRRDLRWGTKGPIQVIDPSYNYPIGIRAFGRWGMRVSDTRSFLMQIVGTQTSTSPSGYISSERIEEYFISEIIQRLSNALARYIIEKKISAFELSACISELSGFVLTDIAGEFSRFGIEVVNFNIERVSIPDDEKARFQEVLGKRMEIDQISQADVGRAYVTMRTFDTLDKLAENSSGAAGQLLGAGLGIGAGLGAGAPLGQHIGSVMNIEPEPGLNLQAPVSRLEHLKKMLDAGLISQEEFDSKKKLILDSI